MNVTRESRHSSMFHCTMPFTSQSSSYKRMLSAELHELIDRDLKKTPRRGKCSPEFGRSSVVCPIIELL